MGWLGETVAVLTVELLSLLVEKVLVGVVELLEDILDIPLGADVVAASTLEAAFAEADGLARRIPLVDLEPAGQDIRVNTERECTASQRCVRRQRKVPGRRRCGAHPVGPVAWAPGIDDAALRVLPGLEFRVGQA